MRKLLSVDKRDRYRACFIVCLLAGGVLRFAGLTRGTSDFVLPEQAREGVEEAFYHFHPDENLVVGAALEPIDLLEPPFTVYGVLPVYLLRGVLKSAAWLLDWEELTLDTPASSRRILYTARTLAALFSCGILGLVWILGRRYFDGLAAGLGVALVAFAPGAIQQAHFYIVDGLFVLLSVAAMYAVLRAVESGCRLWYVAAGVLIGATGAVRLNGMLLGVVLGIGHGVKAWNREEDGDWKRLGRSLIDVDLWLAGAAALGMLLLLEPFLAVSPEILLKADSVEDFGHGMAITRGEFLQPWTLVDVHTTLYLDQWFHLFPLISGWPLTGIFFLGIGYVLWNRNLFTGLMLLWCGIYFLVIGGLPVKVVRYMIPLLPFLALFVGAAGSRFWRTASASRWRWPGRGIVGVLVLHTVIYGVAFGRIYRVEDSRIQAGRWIANHVPANSSIGVEGGSFSARWLISEEDFKHTGLKIATIFYTAPYLLCRMQVDYLRERIAGMDYLVTVDANRAAQFSAVPDLFPVLAGFYEKLASEQLGFERVRRFKHYPEFLGVRFRDDGAEPSFLGYDHPAVLIFKRGDEATVEAAFARWAQEIEENVDCADRQLRQVTAVRKTGDWLQAQQLLQKLLDEHPDAKIAHLLAAEVHWHLGEEERAKSAFRRYRPESAGGLTAHVKSSATIHYVPAFAGLSLVELGLPDLAIKVLRDGVEGRKALSPNAKRQMAESYLAAGERLLSAGWDGHREIALKLALEISPDERAYNVLAQTAYQRGEVEKAVELWKGSLLLDAKQAEIHAHLGRAVLLDLGDSDQALAYLEQAAKLGARLDEELKEWMVSAMENADQR